MLIHRQTMRGKWGGSAHWGISVMDIFYFQSESIVQAFLQTGWCYCRIPWENSSMEVMAVISSLQFHYWFGLLQRQLPIVSCLPQGAGIYIWFISLVGLSLITLIFSDYSLYEICSTYTGSHVTPTVNSMNGQITVREDPGLRLGDSFVLFILSIVHLLLNDRNKVSESVKEGSLFVTNHLIQIEDWN